jgi:hypothetical protein
MATVTVTVDRNVHYITVAGTTAMRTFVRTTTQPFEDTVTGFARQSRLDVIINGNPYGLTRSGYFNAVTGASTSAAANTLPEGHVQGRGQLLAGSSEPNRFYVAWFDGRRPAYTFGFGDPPGDATSSVGGLGPIIIDGLKYGSANQYRQGVPAGAAPVGPPAAQHQPFLTQRSNATYAAFEQRGANVGKVAIAYSTVHDRVTIAVQQDGTAGVTLNALRDALAALGADNAVFLDGSDSAMLYANSRFYIHQGATKNVMTTAGVGFQVR